MDALLIYFLKANIAFAALYLFYRLLLHRDTFFREKRFAFLLGFLFALLHPIIDISSWIESSKPVVYVVQSISTTLPEIVVTDGTRNASLSTQEIIVLAYGIVAALLLLRILWQTVSVLLLAFLGRKEEINGLTVINLPQGTAPFSFFGMIFLNPDDYSTKDLEEILHHEGAHVRQYHSLDVIFAELVCALFWINPFSWLLKRHMRENLEFLADNDVLHSGFDPKSYQYHLLRLSYQQSTANMANHFNVTQLKNRIIMMNKKKTSLAGLGKYALSLPLFAFLLLAAYAWGAKTELPSLNEIAAVSLPSVNEDKPIEAASSKTVSEVVTINAKKSDNEKPKEKAYTVVEVMPAFPGGNEELMKFILGNLRYPSIAKEKNIQGKVIVRFIITETGDVKDIEVLRAADPALDKEAVRVVSLLPKWSPGKQNGKNVNVYYTLPIVFKLQGAETTKDNKKADDKEVVVVGYGASDKDAPYTKVDEMPQYPGGEEALMKHILGNLKYPKTAKDKGIEGRVIIRFVISKTGEVTNVEVLRGLYPDCDNEGVRVIKSMPNWTPGKQDGKEVPVYFTIPIVYRLSKETNNKNLGLLNIKYVNGKEPLFILDGIEYKGAIRDINPSDVQEISVLKDSAATAVYGDKGANGVIVITIKKQQKTDAVKDSVFIRAK